MRQSLILTLNTFHEIIYGKSERGAKVRRVFFVPTQKSKATADSPEVLYDVHKQVRVSSMIRTPGYPQ
jgi:hypothetical protein